MTVILKLHHIPLTFNTSIGTREENKKKINIPSILLFRSLLGSLNRNDGKIISCPDETNVWLSFMDRVAVMLSAAIELFGNK